MDANPKPPREFWIRQMSPDEYGFSSWQVNGPGVWLKTISKQYLDAFTHVIEFPAYEAALAEIESLKVERDEYKKVAEEWMRDYDKLKEKYEPLEIALSHIELTKADYDSMRLQLTAEKSINDGLRKDINDFKSGVQNFKCFACGEYTSPFVPVNLFNEIKLLKEKLSVALEALEFYARTCNWGLSEITFDENRKPFAYIRTEIMNDDDAPFEDKEVYGGKRAREALAKLRDDKNNEVNKGENK